MLQLALIALLTLEPFVTAQGWVQDPIGARIAGAQIFYHRDRMGIDWHNNSLPGDGKVDGAVQTGKEGVYSVMLHPGICDVCVMADNFTPQCRKVSVSAKRPELPVFKLKVDPLAPNFDGDTVR